MRLVMSSFVLGLVLDAVLSDPSTVIPTKEEQANLLRNVEEVFNEVKLMVSDEGGATDAAVINDVQIMVDRAREHLALAQELAILKLSCSKNLENSVSKAKIEKSVQEGQQQLQGCVTDAADHIYNNSQAVTTTMGLAMNQGQVLLDTLNRCSRKSGFNLITCYKKVIATDVFPLKLILVDAIQIHRSGHMEAITIRKRANECIDYVLATHQTQVAQILDEVLLA